MQTTSSTPGIAPALPRGEGLNGARVELTPVGPQDLPALYRWINDRATVELSTPFRAVSWSEHLQWYAATLKRDDAVLFAVRETGRLIGTCQLLGIRGGSAELRIRLGEESSRGKGLGSEAVALLLRHAFDCLKLGRVWLHVFADNERAIRAYRKCGFRDEGVLAGQPREVRVMAAGDDDARRDPPA